MKMKIIVTFNKFTETFETFASYDCGVGVSDRYIGWLRKVDSLVEQEKDHGDIDNMGMSGNSQHKT
jgi:hypothetical protein